MVWMPALGKFVSVRSFAADYSLQPEIVTRLQLLLRHGDTDHAVPLYTTNTGHYIQLFRTEVALYCQHTINFTINSGRTVGSVSTVDSSFSKRKAN